LVERRRMRGNTVGHRKNRMRYGNTHDQEEKRMKKSVPAGIALLLFGIMSLGWAHSALAQKVFNLRWATHLSPASPSGIGYEMWTKKVEEASGGRVKIKIYPLQTLVKGADFYTSVADGISDIQYGVNAMDFSRFPLNTVMDLPLLGFKDAPQGTAVWREVYRKFPEMRAEFKDVKVLANVVGIPRQLHLTKKEVHVPSDIKGMKILATGPGAKALEALGASPMGVLPPEYYMALEKGVAEGVAVDWGVILDSKVIPLLPHHTILNLGYLTTEVLMNQKTWNSLPPEIQKVFNDLEPMLTEQMLQSTLDPTGRENAVKLGHKIYTPTPEELKLWYAGVQAIHDKWLKDNEAKGLPARAIYQEIQNLVNKP
jgi:TRAP-type transport system periplasmic protein